MSSEYEEPRRQRLTRYVLAGATILAITMSTYGRMTGFDAMSRVAGRNPVLSDVLFTLAVAIAAVSAALLLSKLPALLIRPVVACAILMAGVSLVLIGADPNPAEWLRFFAAPVATAALPLLGLANLLALSTSRSRRGRVGTVGPGLLVAVTSVVIAAGFYILTNRFGPKGFFVQTMLILFGAVVPLVSSLSALSLIACDQRLRSPTAAALAIIAAGSLIVLTFL